MNDPQLPKFSYDEATIKDLSVSGSIDVNGRMKVKIVKIKDKETEPTQRFWDSLMARFGFGNSIFTYFEHSEVFGRIAERAPSDEVKLCIQETARGAEVPEGWKPKLLSVSHAEKPMIHDDQLIKVLYNLNAQDITYRSGIVVSHHELRRPMDFIIGGDKFTTKLTVETPIDGYGRPNVFLAMKCDSNQCDLTAYSKTFQSGIIIGGKETADYTLERAIENFNNEDGFAAFKQRLGAAQNSWASVHEFVRLTRIIWKFNNEDFLASFLLSKYGTEVEGSKPRNDLLTSLSDIAGDLRALYSVAQLDAISEKRMRVLPAKCKVYDLIKLAMEMASQKLSPEAARKVQLFIGELISAEYDLEESGTKFGSFEDFANESFKKFQLKAKVEE
jgi:hypothetical protein